MATILRRHSTTRAYLQALAAGGPRYDLNGAASGLVSPKQVRHAQFMLEAMPPNSKRLDLTVKRKIRSTLLKRFEASQLDIQAFAETIGFSEHLLTTELALSRQERTQRHSERRALVERFEASAMDPQAFAVAENVPFHRLQRALSFVAEERASTDGSSSTAVANGAQG